MRITSLVCLLPVVAVALAAASCESGSGTPVDPSQVNIEFITSDLVVGTGNPAVVGNVVTVNYTGWLFDSSRTESKGRQFVSTSTGSPPLVATLGRRQTLAGVEQALVGMRVGGKRRAYVPSNLAYGPSGTTDGTVPANAALVFELEMMNLVQ